MESHGLFVYYSPPNFLILSIKAVSLPCCVGTCMLLAMVAFPEWQFSDDPEQTYFSREISGSLFVSGQHNT